MGEQGIMRSEIRWINYICLYFLMSSLNLFFQTGLSLPGNIFSPIKVGMKVILIGYLLYTVLRTKQRSFFRMLFITIAIVGYFFLKSALMGNAVKDTLKSNLVTIITICAPLFVCASQISESELFFRRFTVTARLSGLVSSLTMYMYTLRNVRNYDSSSGYLLTLSSIALFMSYKDSKRKYDLVLSLGFAFIAIIYGSRGAIVCFLGVLLFGIITLGKMTPRRLSLSIAGILLCIIFVMNLETIINMLPESIISRNMLVLMGANEYVSSFFDSNGRIGIWAYYWSLSLKNPFWGSGIFGDYISLFPHNIFLEILAAEGIVFGLLISIVILWYNLRPLKMSALNDKDKYIYLVFSAVFFEVMLSTDFLLNEMWWVFFGITISMIRINRERSYALFEREIGR